MDDAHDDLQDCAVAVVRLRLCGSARGSINMVMHLGSGF